MAKCGCTSSVCNCVVQAGDGVTVTGAGTAANPYVIAADAADAITVEDTTSVDMTKTGNVISSAVIRDPAATNLLTVGPNGVAVLCESVQDCVGQGFDDGRWVAKSKGGVRAFFAGAAVTDAAGNAVFNFPAGTFPAAPNVAAAIQAAASNQPIDFRITALTNTSCTINVRQSPVLIVLSLSVLGVAAPLAGVTVHAIATPAGATP